VIVGDFLVRLKIDAHCSPQMDLKAEHGISELNCMLIFIRRHAEVTLNITARFPLKSNFV
jgi:hypothetical protein